VAGNLPNLICDCGKVRSSNTSRSLFLFGSKTNKQSTSQNTRYIFGVIGRYNRFEYDTLTGHKQSDGQSEGRVRRWVQEGVDRQETNGQDGKMNGRIDREKEVQAGRQEDWFIYYLFIYLLFI
jgi:hypothetical protein